MQETKTTRTKQKHKKKSLGPLEGLCTGWLGFGYQINNNKNTCVNKAITFFFTNKTITWSLQVNH